MLIALFLTAISASPARSESWFKFGRWGKKATPAAQVSDEAVLAPAGFVSVSDADVNKDKAKKYEVVNIADEVCDDEDSDGHLSRWQERRQERKVTRQARRDAQAIVMEPAPCYPPLNSSLYPCPRPDVPYEVGQTLITNQAFYPHEMLYAHRYRAIYPPYFYANKCGLSCLPFFPKPCLKGTVVTVKYKSTLPRSKCASQTSSKPAAARNALGARSVPAG
jgi:hypothetical protein